MPPDSGLSPARFGAMVAEGYTSPRRSMARILGMQPDERARLLMVAIGIVISSLGFVALGQRAEEAGPDSVFLGYIVAVLAGLLQYYIFAWVIGTASRAFGGEGDREQDRTLVAWWALVTSPLPVLMVVGMQKGESPVAALLMVGAAILSFVLLAAYIAEVHRFRSTARVCGAIMGMLLVLSLVLSSLLPMPG